MDELIKIPIVDLQKYLEAHKTKIEAIKTQSYEKAATYRDFERRFEKIYPILREIDKQQIESEIINIMRDEKITIIVNKNI